MRPQLEQATEQPPATDLLVDAVSDVLRTQYIDLMRGLWHKADAWDTYRQTLTELLDTTLELALEVHGTSAQNLRRRIRYTQARLAALP